MKNWHEMKREVESLLQTTPQRGALATRAIQQVESGLLELAKAGFMFEPGPKGALAVQHEIKPQTRPLSINDSISIIRGQQPALVESAGSEVFNAK